VLRNVIQDLESALWNNVINISGFQTRRGNSRTREPWSRWNIIYSCGWKLCLTNKV